MIILTAEQAEQARGPMLDPRQMVDGNFVLPEAVLADPTHADWHDLLASLPRRDVTAADFPASADD